MLCFSMPFVQFMVIQKKIISFTVSLTQVVQSNCCSKYLSLAWLLTIKKLGIFTSYESLERIYTRLTQKVIRDVGDHRVPIPTGYKF